MINISRDISFLIILRLPDHTDIILLIIFNICQSHNNLLINFDIC